MVKLFIVLGEGGYLSFAPLLVGFLSDESEFWYVRSKTSHENGAPVDGINSGDLLIINTQSTFQLLGQCPYRHWGKAGPLF